MEESEAYAIFSGWQIDSRLRLKGSKQSRFPYWETLREKIIRICEEKSAFHVYFLVWDHAYFYVLEREAWQGRVWDHIHPRIHFVFDSRHLFGGSHHEKVSIFDGKVALCGGIDLCDERWDTPQHLYHDPRRSLDGKRENHGPYHDLAVQVTGPICVHIQKHIERRWVSLSSVPFPCRPEEVQDTSGHSVYLSRTIASVDQGPDQIGITREIEFLFKDLIQAAQDRIILEGQYFWSEAVNDLLIAKMYEKAGQKFEVIVILAELQPIQSLTRYMMPYELFLIKKLQSASDYCGVNLTIGSPYVHELKKGGLFKPRPVYIHSKIIVIDDRYLGIGSANFAARAFRVDTEMHLTLEAKTMSEKNHIKGVADRIIEHWNISGNPSLNIHFRLFKPIVDSEYFYEDGKIVHLISWQFLFDPLVSWFSPLRWKYRRLFSRHHSLFSFWILLIWALEVVLIGLISGQWKEGRLSLIACTFLQASIWLDSVPFVLFYLISIFLFGLQKSVQNTILSLWLASFLGYFFARIFPVKAAALCSNLRSLYFRNRLGTRDFSILMLTVMDPWIDLQSKIIYQGILCIPLPWFLLATGIVLPSIIYFLGFGIDYLIFNFIDLSVVRELQVWGDVVMIFMTIFYLGKVFLKIWRKIN